MNMKIWAHTLVKNEAKWLWYSVTSVIDYVDKLLLWDTGSTDRTLEIVKGLKNKYSDKIEFREYGNVTPETFTKARQGMLDATTSDWFIVLDADEVWWNESIRKVTNLIQRKGNELESIVVPNILPVGDIFHYQEEAGGKYKIAGKEGHFNLRAVNRKIPGLHALGPHGLMGWVDGDDKMIQDRSSEKIAFTDSPYLHMTYLPRASSGKDSDVIKRKGKRKFELGIEFPKDFFYPEVFCRPCPAIVESPWQVTSGGYRVRSFFETPLRKIKRRFLTQPVGY